MKIALFFLALLGSATLALASDRVPNLNVESLCKETSAIDKAMGLAEAQSFADCMRDETAARQQLSSAWASTPAAIRDRCEAEATLAGVASYVDLLSCMQLSNSTGSLASSSSPLRGASKNRNSK